MEKKTIGTVCGTVCFLALTAFGTADAQTVFRSQKAGVMHMTLPEKTKSREVFAKDYPLIANQLTLQRNFSSSGLQGVKPVIDKIRSLRKARANQADAGNTVFWADASYVYTDESYAYNSFCSFTTSPFDFTKLLQNDKVIARNGICVKDGELYCLETEFNTLEIGLVEVIQTLRSYDINTWEENFEPIWVGGVGMTAIETAQAVDGTVYGEFYNQNMTGLEWGIVDYANQTRTTISTAVNTFVALGITSGGQLYGVATDGNLYKIDKTTGEETVVGPTGVNLQTDEGQYYNQCGEIDPLDDTFYWAAVDSRGNTALYTVDLQTGAATKQYSYDAALYGMIFPQAAAAAGAPARVADLSLDFDGGSLSGNITFTVPDRTFSGDPLSGNLDYSVYAGDELVANGTASAGEKVSAPVSFDEEGQYNIVVRTSNAAGQSPKAKLKAWIGNDTPQSVTDVKVVVDENRKAVLTWKAPTGTVHGGYLGDLKYDVYRTSNGDSVLVGQDLAETSFEEIIPKANLANYNYVVYAKNGTMRSEGVSSNDFVTGDAITPDYVETFATNNSMALFTVIDVNNDGNTWNWATNDGVDGYVYSMFSNDHGNDDWIITPPMHLQPKYTYTLSYRAKEWLPKFPNTMEVKFGTSATPEGMTTTIQETMALTGELTEYSYTVSVPEEGDYYFGFHDNTEASGQYRIMIDSLAVAANPISAAPDVVTSFKVVPDAAGEQRADLQFDIPQKNVGGAAISKVDSLQIMRDGKLIATVGEKKAGERTVYTDYTPGNAIYKYSVRAFLDGEFGPVAYASAFVGTDVPGVPEQLKVMDNGDKVNISWAAFERGVNGGYIDASDISVTAFSVYNYPYFGPQVKDSLTTSAKGALSVDIEQDPEASVDGDGLQSMVYYGVRANGKMGESEVAITDGFLVGPSYPVPFKESMKGGGVDNGIIWFESSQVKSDYGEYEHPASWALSTNLSADNDGGAAIWMPYSQYGETYTINQGDMCSLNMPKVALGGCANPQMLFSVYATKNDPVKLEVVAMAPDKTETCLETIDLSSNAKEGWYRYMVDLGGVKDGKYVIMKFRATSTGTGTILGLDDIRMFNQYDNNLAVNGISVPKYVVAGKTGKVSVEVENIGKVEAKDFSIRLLADGEPVDTVKVSTALPVFEKQNVELTLPVKINAVDVIRVKAELLFDADMDESDNSTDEAEVKVESNDYPVVTDLKADDASSASLSWSAPVPAQPMTKTEDFESYDGWTVDGWGHWTTIDNDDAYAGQIFSDISLPHEGEKYAYVLMDVSGDYASLAPYYGNHTDGGTKYLSAFYGVNSGGTDYEATDNWLISPMLSGKSQTVSFFAENHNNGSKQYPETLYVHYSTGDASLSDFQQVGDAITVSSGDWQQYSVELPEGARYFAIENKNVKGAGLWLGIDDITYEAAAPGEGETIVGYNIYRDGEFFDTVNGATLSYVDNQGDGVSHRYNVTVVYEDKNGVRTESAFSNTVTATPAQGTGIDGVNAEPGSSFNVYTVDGKTVVRDAKNLDGLSGGIYIVNDKKVILE